MREEYIRDGYNVYWNHGGVMEMLLCIEQEDGARIYLSHEGKEVSIKNEDELSPMSSRFYRRFDKMKK